MAVPMTSKIPFRVISVIPTPNSANTSPTSAAKSSSRITGSSGALAERMNFFQDCWPRVLLDSMMAVRKEKLSAMIAATEHDQRHPPPRPVQQAVGFAFVHLVPLVVRLVEGEQPADAEQHHGDDEAEDVAFPPVAERMLRGRSALGSPPTDQQQDLVTGVGHRVDRLGQHRRRAGQGEGRELRHRDERVGQQGGDDGLGPTLCTHAYDPARPKGNPR